MHDEALKKIEEGKVIAIVRGYYGATCVKLVEALNAGGIKLLEVTFDQSSAEDRLRTADTIRLLNESLGDRMLFGAGTVTSTEMVRAAHEAGAAFIISPDTNKEVIRETRRLGMVSIPGAFSPTEITKAHDFGGDLIKVFPANVLGPGYFKSVRAPLNNISLLAVGGVDAGNIRAYLEAGCAGAGLASCLYRKEWIAEGAWDKITEAAEKLLEAVREY